MLLQIHICVYIYAQFIYLLEKQNDRAGERDMLLFISEWLAWLGLFQAIARRQELLPVLPHGCQEPTRYYFPRCIYMELHGKRAGLCLVL